MDKYILTIIFKIAVLYFLTLNSLLALNVTYDTEFLIDNNGTITLQDIKNDTALVFSPINKESLNFGFSDATFWLRVKVENTTDKLLRKYIIYKDPLVGYLDIYFKDKVKYFGVLRKHDIPYIDPTFPIELKPREQAYIYLKVFSDVTPINIKVYLDDEQEMNKNELTNHFIMSMFFGFLIALIVYNASIYFSIKDKLYIYYILYVLSILIHHFGYKGFMQLYITLDPLPYILTHPVPLMDAFMITTVLLFTAIFLHIKRYKKIYIIFHILAIGSILNALIMFYPPFYNLEIVFLWALMSIIIVVSSAIYLTVQGVEYSRIYLLGWVPLTLMFIMLLLRQIFGINLLEHLPYFEELAIAFEATIFSVALSLRIKRINEEKNEATAKLLNFEQDAKQNLETEVYNKTKELNHRLSERNTLLQELNHRVKNNMQIIISMLRLQAKKYGKHEQEIVQIAENRIRSMLFIHELLYEKGENVSFEPKEYFTLLIVKICDSFSFKKECVTLNIEAFELNNDIVVNLGFIINELLTNSIKHAKPKNELHIDIVLCKREDEIVLTFRDNGISFNAQKDGLGTLFIDSMVKEQLKGKIQRRFDDGYKVDINMPDKKSDAKVM